MNSTTQRYGVLPAASYHRPWLRYIAPVDGDGGSGGAQQPAEGSAPPAPAPTPPAAPAQPQQPATGAQNVEELPDWAQKLIRDARADAGKARTDAKAAAADEARTELVDRLAVALGIKQDGQQLTPEQLQAQLAQFTQERDQATNGTIALQRENAVHRLAAGLGADSAKLVDSRTFIDKLQTVDPSDTEAVSKAIKDALAADQTFALVRVPGSSGGTQHHGDTPSKPTDLASAIAAHYPG